MRRTSRISTSPANRWSTSELLEAKGAGEHRISVVLPACDEEATVGRVIEALRATVAGPERLVDEIVVIDSFSSDATAETATAAGASVHHCDDIDCGLAALPGKGEALWRSLFVTHGDLVVFIDADLEDAGPHYVTGLLGPLLTETSVELVKGFYDRPLLTDTGVVPHGGGRVTELMARPLLNLHWPALADVVQPLAGEYAARRSLLESLPFPVGYGVEMALLVDTLAQRGPSAIAQVDLGRRTHRHQAPAALGVMAAQVLATAHRRLGLEPVTTAMRQFVRTDGTTTSVDTDIEHRERPPASTVEAYRRAPAHRRAVGT